jgi:hypothetical protein
LKALLVDTGFSARPLLVAARALSYETAIVGGRSDDFLAASIKPFFHSDYSNSDTIGQLFDSQGFSGLIPGCTDVSYQTCSALLGRPAVRGVDSSELSRCLHDKAAFRALCYTLNLPAPECPDAQAALAPEQSVIVKPVDSYSGRGISVVEAGQHEQFQSARDRACRESRSDTCIVEAFVSGQLYSTSAFIRDGRIVQSFLVEEHCGETDYAVRLSRTVAESRGGNRARTESDIQAIASHLALQDGLMHLQWIEDGQDYWLIELTRRCPGDLYARLIQLSTGYDYALAYVAPFLGSEVHSDKACASRQDKGVLRMTVHGTANTVFCGVTFNSAVRVIEFVPTLASGDLIGGSTRVGVLFIETDALASDSLSAWVSEEDIYRVECIAAEHWRT